MWFDMALDGGMALAGQIGNLGFLQGQVKEDLSALANRTEQELDANLQAFRAGAITANQAYSTGWGLFDGMIEQMMTQYGARGRQSAEERDRRLGSGNLRWDWITYYLDPLGNPDAPGFQGAQGAPGGVRTAGVGGIADGLTSAFRGQSGPVILLAVGAVALLMIWGKK